MNIKYQVFCVYLECEDGDNHLAECSYFDNSDVYSKGIYIIRITIKSKKI